MSSQLRLEGGCMTLFVDNSSFMNLIRRLLYFSRLQLNYLARSDLYIDCAIILSVQSNEIRTLKSKQCIKYHRLSGDFGVSAYSFDLNWENTVVNNCRRVHLLWKYKNSVQLRSLSYRRKLWLKSNCIPGEKKILLIYNNNEETKVKAILLRIIKKSLRRWEDVKRLIWHNNLLPNNRLKSSRELLFRRKIFGKLECISQTTHVDCEKILTGCVITFIYVLITWIGGIVPWKREKKPNILLTRQNFHLQVGFFIASTSFAPGA